MRQVQTAGEKAFVDYAGMRPTIVVDALTGEVQGPQSKGPSFAHRTVG